MPDPLPPTVAIEPAGYALNGRLMNKDEIDQTRVASTDTVAPVYYRDDIAPLRVPLVDQHNNVMGHENRKARELLIERVWTDKDGVVWSRPTAFAYAAVCEARHQWEMTAGDARALLAALVDELAASAAQGGKITPKAAMAARRAEEFLNKTSRSRNIDTPKEPTE